MVTGWQELDGRQRRVLACTLSANALVFFDQTAVVVALPAIGREFRAHAAELQWTITAYLLGPRGGPARRELAVDLPGVASAPSFPR
jgi:MFS family permease